MATKTEWDVPTTANLSEYTLGEQIGRGSFGRVFRALKEGSDRPVAIKIVPADKDYKALMDEIAALRLCDSPYITRYFGSAVSDGDIWIILEYCGGGSVSELVSAKKTLPLPFIVTVTAAMTAGLLYLHEQRLLHRDVKCSNVLLTEEGAVKLADFGVCTTLKDTMAKRNTLIGTPFWMAPEVIKEESYDFKADIWSLGISVIEMADGVPPFSHMHPMRAIFLIPMMPKPPAVRNESDFPDEMNDFIASCLTIKCDDRPSSSDMYKHPFIADELIRLNKNNGISEELGAAVRDANETLAAIRMKKAENTNKDGGESKGSQSGDDSYAGSDPFNNYINPNYDYDPSDDVRGTDTFESSSGYDGVADFYALGLATNTLPANGANISSGSNSPMMNSSGYSMAKPAGTEPKDRGGDSGFSSLTLSTTDVGVGSTPTNRSANNASSANSDPLGGIGSGGMGKVNGFVLGGGLPAFGARRKGKNGNKLRPASRRPRSKDAVHSQLRAIDEQYRCDLVALEQSYREERRRLMTALRLAQEADSR